MCSSRTHPSAIDSIVLTAFRMTMCYASDEIIAFCTLAAHCQASACCSPSDPNSQVGLHVDSGDLSRGMEALTPKSYVFVLLGLSLVDLVRFELTTSSMQW